MDRDGISDSVESTADAEELKELIVRSLTTQGFQVKNGSILPPSTLSKDKIRKLHETAIKHKIAQAKRGLIRKEADLLSCIASGNEVSPLRIRPRLVEVKSGSKEELLFRYASAHWSIPVSSGYGRRLRFVVIDEDNNKLMGLIGLGDPVYNLRPRDEWIGWNAKDRRGRLTHIMDAFVLGSVPPYSLLLCGKLIAMLAVSSTVVEAFKEKYGGERSVIQERVHDGRLAMLTTTSALGRSSVYNRIRFDDRLLYRSVGFTRGSGEFHFSNGIYSRIAQYASEHCKPTAKQKRWGTGFRNRREIIKKCLPALGLPSEWLYHGVEREVFVIPLASNSRDFLQGKQDDLMCYTHSEDDIFEYFRDRWMLPRYAWDRRYESWSKREWAIWLNGKNNR